MTQNDRIILDEILRQQKLEVAPTLSESDFFELFVAEQILKDFDLSYDELESGLVGGGSDGGIDGFYVLVNGELANEDSDLSQYRRNVEVHVFILQAKTSATFSETPVERLQSITRDIFDLSVHPQTLGVTYRSEVVEAIVRFREVYQQLASRFPGLHIHYVYGSRGDAPHDNVRRKADRVVESVRQLFPTAEVFFGFAGASELLALARRQPQTVHQLPLAENPISAAGQGSFVCLVQLKDFKAFITDDKGELRRPIFEANVRDYQGRTEVNDAIQSSLQARGPEDFWWLNNGVTILASRVSQAGKTLTIEDPQIVNGLQTSTEVFNYFRTASVDPQDSRTVLVRVIAPSATSSSDRIIKATNSQTAVQQASLRATDKIHRDIEEYLRPRNLFYDRRKNFYKNESRPRDRVVGIPYLAQAVMAVLLRRPNTARARPSSLLKSDEDYRLVYNSDYPIHVYYVCAQLMRRLEGRIRNMEPPVPPRDRNNLRFYAAMQAVVSALGLWDFTPEQLGRLDVDTLTDRAIETAILQVQTEYTALGGDDTVAKSARLLETLKQRSRSEGQGSA